MGLLVSRIIPSLSCMLQECRGHAFLVHCSNIFAQKRAWKKVLNTILRKRESRRKERGKAEKKEVHSYSYKSYSEKNKQRTKDRSIDTPIH